MRILLQDLRFGLRMLVKNPRFTTLVVLTLALGIGATTAVFSFLDHALFRRLPVPKPQELVAVGFRTDAGNVEAYGGFHYPLYAHYRDESKVFSGLLAFASDAVTLTIEESMLRVPGAGVSGNYFSVLGIQPILGRALAPQDDTPGAPPVTVISHRLWRRELGGDPAILGKTIEVDGYALTIVGVTPPEFTGTFAGISTGVYMPLHAWARMNNFSPEEHNRTWWMLLGRLRPGVSREQAEANLKVLGEQFKRIDPLNVHPETILSDGSQGYSVWRDKGLWRALTLFQVPSALILLIACANVANMVLARATTRRKEIAIRLGLGATRWDVIRQLLCENMLLALLNGACGALVAQWLSGLLRSTVMVAGGIDMPGGVDARIFGFTLLVSLVATLLSGLVPALRASQTDVVSMLKDSPGIIEILRRRWSLRNLLVVGQVAVSMIVLVFGVLCLRSVKKFHSLGAGFEAQRILAVEVSSKGSDKPGSRVRPFLDDLGARVASWPGVEAVSLASEAPLSATGNQRTGMRHIEGFQFPPDQDSLSVDFDVVSPGYFQMLGVPLLKGRHFSVEDGPATTPVMIVDAAFAQRYWPGEDPIGKRITFSSNEVREVVGVVKTARLWSLREPSRPFAYWPLAQSPQTKPVLLIRTTTDPQVLAPAVRQALSPLGPNPADYDTRTVAARISDLLSTQRTIGQVLNALGILGLLFAATGIAAVMAYEVSRRTREIGIRVALGAQYGDVLKSVLRRGMILTGVGLVLGISISAVPAWLLCTLLPDLRVVNDHFLYGVRAWDPVTYAMVSLLLAAVAMAACYLPARRAARIDPMAALRHE
jgi:predicted permease